VPSTYGKSATSRLDESWLLAIREVSDVLRYSLALLGHCFSLVLKMRFPPSVVESKHGWRTAMHLQGRNGVENRNGACAMEVASLGSRAKMRTKEGGIIRRQQLSRNGTQWNEGRGLDSERNQNQTSRPEQREGERPY